MDNLELLEKLCCANGVSGNDTEVCNIIIDEIKDSCERLYFDKAGNLIAFKMGKKVPKNKIMVCAHTDEVGLMITGIQKDGTLSFEAVGGIDPRVLSSKRVTVAKDVNGIICSKPIHCQNNDERKKATLINDMVIDIGALNKKQAEKFVSIGDTVAFKSDFLKLGNNKVKAKALDDRLGCFIMCNIINSEIEYDTFFAFVQCEEVGCRGSMSAAYHLKPDIGIILEATTAADIAGVVGDKRVCEQGNGGVLSIADNGTIYDRQLYHIATECATKNDIKSQIKKYISGGNDSRSIQLSQDGAKVIAISAPCRYLHTPSCVVDINDIFEMQKLCEKLIGEYGELGELNI